MLNFILIILFLYYLYNIYNYKGKDRTKKMIIFINLALYVVKQDQCQSSFQATI